MTIAKLGPNRANHRRFRLWLVLCDIHWNPARWDEVPRHALALEPVVDAAPSPLGDGCVSADQAAAYLEAFNRAMIADHQRRWAVALPVEIRYDGEPTRGDDLAWPTLQSLSARD